MGVIGCVVGEEEGVDLVRWVDDLADAGVGAEVECGVADRAARPMSARLVGLAAFSATFIVVLVVLLLSFVLGVFRR